MQLFLEKSQKVSLLFFSYGRHFLILNYYN